jgi:hypothetical protein
MASEVLAPHQNFHLIYSGDTQPQKRCFPKAETITTIPIRKADPMHSYELRSESQCRPVAPQQQPSHHATYIPGRPLSSPPRIERETSIPLAARGGIGFSISEEPQRPPPIGEIRIPMQANIFTSPSSPSCSASLPTTTNHSNADYESLYCSTVRENHRLQQRLDFVSEENRSLKRHLIELQRRLFTARRNNRGRRREGPLTNDATTVNEDSDDVRGWSVPQSSHKRIKRDDSFTMSPKVPQSVSSEETVVLES